jgi:hypothetical protein
VYAMRDSSTTDSGTAITTQIRTKHYEHDVERDKVWRYLMPELEWLGSTQYNLTVTGDTDYDEQAVSQGDTGTIAATGLVWGTSAWGATNWGSARFRTKNKLWWYSLRGGACSFHMTTLQRIRLTSLQAKFKQVGPY